MADKPTTNKGVSTLMNGFKVPALNLTGKKCK